MISKFINWLAKKKRRIFIPKIFYRWYWLTFCDYCCDRNLINPCDVIVEYKLFKYRWQKEKTLGYVYRHAHDFECKKNRILSNLLYEKDAKQEKEEREKREVTFYAKNKSI